MRNFGHSLPVVVPALLMCDFGHLADEIQRIEAAGAQVLHLDVMDGHFVPNLTYGLTIVDAVRRYTELPIETHLMISNPADFLEAYHNAGADHLTFHIEAVADPRPLLDEIHRLGAGAGLAFNPPTPLSAIEPYLDACDTVLVMSVMPGFGGQEFDTRALEKLRHLRERGPEQLMLGVDGGIHPATIGPAAEAGAQFMVAGSAIFAKQNYREALDELTALARRSATDPRQKKQHHKQTTRPKDGIRFAAHAASGVRRKSAISSMVQIALIRPGTTDYDLQGRIQGRLDIPLNQQGQEQVAQAIECLRAARSWHCIHRCAVRLRKPPSLSAVA